MKKFLTTLLCIIMIMAMMPMVTGVAFADELSNWSKLDKAMKGEETYATETTIKDGAATPTNLFKVKDTTDGSVTTRTITLLSDITAEASDNSLEVPSGTNIVLDLNGHVLDANSGAFSVIQVANGGKLTVIDNKPETEHKGYVGENGLWHLGTPQSGETAKDIKGGIITGSSNPSNGDGGGVYADGNFTMNGGNIAGNTVKNGGGVYVSYDGNFTMNSGTIYGNKASTEKKRFGGGVYADGSFTMTGGTISGNSACNGGGIYVNGTATLSNALIENNSSKNGGGISNYCSNLVVDHCTIRNNKATSYGGGISNNGNTSDLYSNGTGTISNTVITGNTAKYGGGIHNGYQTFLKDNVTITSNTATSLGGGISGYGQYGFQNGQYDSQKVQITFAGKNIVIKDNICTGNQSLANLAVENTYPVNITAALTGSVIYAIVFNDTTPVTGLLTSGFTTNNEGAKLDDFFHYDGPSTHYMDWNTGNTELVVKAVPANKYAISIPSIPNGKVTSNKQIEGKDGEVKLTITPADGYRLKADSLKVNNGAVSVNKTNDTTYTFSMPNGPATVTAEFEKISNWSKLGDAFSGKDSYSSETTIRDDEANPLFKVKDVTEGGVTTRTITLLSDITANSTNSALVVSGTNIVLDLNGHVLDRGLVKADGTPTLNDHGSVIEVYGELTIKDSASTKPHEGFVDANGLWHLAADGHPIAGTETTKTIKGGIITGGTGCKVEKEETQYQGGGIIIALNGKVTMERGTIAGNSVQDNGGGIMIQSSSEFTMLGGSITNNSAYADDGAGGGIWNGGTCELNGGTITDNSSVYGGGCYNTNGFILKETSITGNKAKCGGGIYNFYYGGYCSNALISILEGSGITVKNNTSTKDDGHNIATDRSILINTKLTNVEIYVTFNNSDEDETTEGKLTSGYKEKNPNAKLDDFFHYDGPSTYYMDLNTEGENAGELEVKAVPENNYLIDIKKSEHGSVSAVRYATTNTNVTLTVTPASGYELEKLTYTYEGNTTPIDITSTKSFTMPDKAVEISATFKLIQKDPTPVPAGPGRPSSYFIEYYNQGIGNKVTKMEVKSGDLIDEPTAPTAEGYEFAGWYKDEKCTQVWDFNKDRVFGYTKLYAKWNIKDDGVKNLIDEFKIRANSKYVKHNGKYCTQAYTTILYGHNNLKMLKNSGYTVKYTFYRSDNKSKNFEKMYTSKTGKYINSKGVKGKMYYYRAVLKVYDQNGKLVASTKLNQCKYGNRAYRGYKY